jgi:hypothetical protein
VYASYDIPKPVVIGRVGGNTHQDVDKKFHVIKRGTFESFFEKSYCCSSSDYIMLTNKFDFA